MDDVVCQGDEASLSHCIFTGWGSSDCESDEAAGVKCINKTEMPKNYVKKKRESKKLHEVLDLSSTSLRLAGGNSNNEGRVEVS